jgi:hypothetical protein
MGAANAVITPSGAQNGNGVPTFYKDAQGLALALCTDPGATEAACGAPDAGPVDGHFGVYFDAASSLGNANNPVLDAGWAIEAAQDDLGNPAVFNATRFRLNGLRPNTTYKITDPWGTKRCTTDASGGADCKFESPGGFNQVRTARISTFLRVVGRSGGEMIGPDLAKRVTGSPTGFNKLVMTGGGRTWSTNLFTLLGQKRAGTAMSSLNKMALELGTGRSANVVTRTIRYSSIGTAAARPTVRKGGASPGAFSVRDTCASQAPGSVCSIMVTFAPGKHANSTKRAVLTINDNGLAAPRKVSLKGIGVRR